MSPKSNKNILSFILRDRTIFKGAMTLSITPSITIKIGTLSIMTLETVMLRVVYAECHYDECCGANDAQRNNIHRNDTA
jgi:hypothetical protein